jgi:IS30 family transposase
MDVAMGKTYEQLSLEERCTIARLREAGKSVRQIASALDRSPSTIAREIKRNADVKRIYKPSYAQQISQSRRWKGSRLVRNLDLQKTVLHQMACGWSPEQVAGRLKRENGQKIISHESIYRFIYSQITRNKDYSWRHYLPRGKAKRGVRRPKKGRSSKNFIVNRISIHQRPRYIQLRKQLGHWEADLMLFSKYGQAALVVHERSSRLLFLKKQLNKASGLVAKRLEKFFLTIPPELRRTVTFDNGTEFARHHELNPLGIRTFFCDTHSPWQKGGIENAIGRLRRGLPRRTDLVALSDSALLARVTAYNHTPRKCLAYQTPAEVFIKNLLHFKCECTSPLSRG